MEPLVPAILVTGSRDWPDIGYLNFVLSDTLHDATQLGYPGLRVKHGMAKRGADPFTHAWSLNNAHLGVRVEPDPADWEDPCVPGCRPGHRQKIGKHPDFCPTAGHRRNQRMVDSMVAEWVGVVPVLALAFRSNIGSSRGTNDCMGRAKTAGLRIRLIEPLRRST